MTGRVDSVGRGSVDAHSDAGYTIRQYRPNDRDAFLELFGEVFDATPDSEWFAWKYEENPYVDHVPVIVAEAGEELVGARSFFALEMEVGSRRETVLQPCDTMVLEDHRRQGLFTRMTEAAIERYRGSVPFFFNFPNEQSLPANRELGWRVVVEAPNAYRVHRPGRLVATRVPSVAGEVAAAAIDGAVAGYRRLRSRSSAVDSTGVAVERTDAIPASAFANLNDRRGSEGFQLVRDERFYRWRFRNPEWKYVSYLARRDGDVVAGAIVGTRGTGSIVRLTELLPTVDQDLEGLSSLVGAALADFEDAALLAGAPDVLPSEIQSAFGFVRTDTFPLSRVSRRTTLAVRPLPSGRRNADLRERDWSIDGQRLDETSNWQVTFSEQDWC